MQRVSGGGKEIGPLSGRAVPWAPSRHSHPSPSGHPGHIEHSLRHDQSLFVPRLI